jgi:hypothetical protein
MMEQCSVCIAPANPEKPMVTGVKPTCDRHCGYSPTGKHEPDPANLDFSDAGSIYLTCSWCGQAGAIRKVDIRWI